MGKSNENPLQFWEKSDKTQTDLESAQERFRPKSFYEQFKPLERISRAFTAVLPSLSVVTGAVALCTVFSSLIGFYGGLTVGFLLVVSVEIAKAKTLDIGFTIWHTNRVYSYPVLGLAFIMSILSAYLSIDGAKEIYSSTDTSIHDKKSYFQAQKDSLNAHYGGLIATEEKALSDFKSSVSWRGKIDMSNKGTIATISAREKQIERLSSDLSTELYYLSETKRKSLETTENSFSDKLTVLVCVVSLIELFIMLCNWFPVYFQWKSKTQSDIIRRNLEGDTITVSSSDFGRFFQDIVLPNVPLINASNRLNGGGSNDSNPQRIGFTTSGINSGLNPVKDGLNVSELEKYLDKHSDVVMCINEGLTESEVLKKTNVSRSTYYNVKRVVNNLDSGKVSHNN